MSDINKDTQLCISISEKPGNFGTTLHNVGYKALNINYLYKSFAVTNIEKAIEGVRTFNIRGCSISMPFKESVIPYLDSLHHSAQISGAVNSVVNNFGYLIGYNTDVIGIMRSIGDNIDKNSTVLVLGCGGFARATLCALKQLGFQNISVACRTLEKLKKLKAIAEFNTVNWDNRSDTYFDIVINATCIGMSPQVNIMPIDLYTINNSKVIIDAVVSPYRTMLIQTAALASKKVIPGYKISFEQLMEQFMLYTGLEAPREVLEVSLKQLVND